MHSTAGRGCDRVSVWLKTDEFYWFQFGCSSTSSKVCPKVRLPCLHAKHFSKLGKDLPNVLTSETWNSHKFGRRPHESYENYEGRRVPALADSSRAPSEITLRKTVEPLDEKHTIFGWLGLVMLVSSDLGRKSSEIAPLGGSPPRSLMYGSGVCVCV